MKKRLFGMVLSILLAFGMVLGVMPGVRVEAAISMGSLTFNHSFIQIYADGTRHNYEAWDDSKNNETIVYENNNDWKLIDGKPLFGIWDTYIADKEGVILTISSSSYTIPINIEIENNGVVITDFDEADTALIAISSYAPENYTLSFNGTNSFSLLDVRNKQSIIQCNNGATLTVGQCYGTANGFYGVKFDDASDNYVVDTSNIKGKIILGDNTIASPESDIWENYAIEPAPYKTTDSEGHSIYHNAYNGLQAVTFSYKAPSSSGGSSAGISPETLAALTGNGSAAANVSTTPVAASSATPDMSANSSIDSAKVKTAENGTAKIRNIESEAEEIEIDDSVEVNGVFYKVKTIGSGAFKKCSDVKTVTLPASVTKIEKNAFKGAKNLKTIRINTKKSFKVQKGAFNGVSTKKMTIKVSKKMSDKQYKTLQKTLTKAGYQGKLTRVLK